MGLRCHGKELANLVVGVRVFGQCKIDLSTYERSEFGHSEAIVEVMEVKGFERAEGVELGEVLRNIRNYS